MKGFTSVTLWNTVPGWIIVADSPLPQSPCSAGKIANTCTEIRVRFSRLRSKRLIRHCTYVIPKYCLASKEIVLSDHFENKTAGTPFACLTANSLMLQDTAGNIYNWTYIIIIFCSYYTAEQDAQEYMHSGDLQHNSKIKDMRNERRRFWLRKQEHVFFFTL